MATYDVGYKKPPEHSRFKPGESGNLKGRPKDTLTAGLRALIFEEEPERYQAIIKETANLAVTRSQKGQIPALSMVWDRIDGKLIERHLSLTVTTTPERLEQARLLLREDKATERALLAEYGTQEAKEGDNG